MRHPLRQTSPPILTVLLCIFASPRSSRAQIDRLIRYLEEMRDLHRDEPESMQLLEGLLAKANGWVASASAEYRALAPADERAPAMASPAH